MIFVYGGKYNGKLDYIKKVYNISDSEIYDFEDYIYNADIEDIFKNYKCLYNIQYIIKNMIKDNIDIKMLYDIVSKYQSNDNIVVSDDISCGIVPIDKIDRIYREEVSKFNTFVATLSKEVYRIFVGIATKIK